MPVRLTTSPAYATRNHQLTRHSPRYRNKYKQSRRRPEASRRGRRQGEAMLRMQGREVCARRMHVVQQRRGPARGMSEPRQQVQIVHEGIRFPSIGQQIESISGV
ncbi:hypothetical protein FH972_023976 [Carpinus fangiana]|uniref:Uncharacterized protein n=1 Tax=Carpinus fangiana TaxID=176857 RepID=A0A5N6KWQ6_9ROSI|nr:hypothetical protein FH972_023976 [Carpinus fangiana]